MFRINEEVFFSISQDAAQSLLVFPEGENWQNELITALSYS